MKALPYFKWYPADAETDANFRAMDDADIGFYIRCLNHAWINGGIPADPKERSRVMRTRLDIANRRWERVGKCFVKSTSLPDLLINLRQEVERESARDRSVKAAESVKHRYERRTDDVLRARASYSDTDTDTTNTPPVVPQEPNAPDGALTHTSPAITLLPKPDPKKRRSGKRTTKEIEKALGAERLEWWRGFWSVYPCRDGMNPGMDAFERKVRDRETAVEVYHGAKRYAAKYAADPTIMLKYPQGWINDERWKDAGIPRQPARSAEDQRNDKTLEFMRILGKVEGK